MISIIVCSYKKDLLNMLRRNIDATIGVPYELIKFREAEMNLQDLQLNFVGSMEYGRKQ